MSSLVQNLIMLGSAVMLMVSIYLLSIFNRLFARVNNTWLRKNLAVMLVGTCFMFSMVAVSTQIYLKAQDDGLLKTILVQLGQSMIIIAFVFNLVWIIMQIPAVKRMKFIWHHAIVMLGIIVGALIIYSIINYVVNDYKFVNLRVTIVFAFYNALATGLVYTAVNYVDLDRKRKLKEKELEVAQLTVLKTKAELDALHSKVNPHFLYNALNSIADLAVTDGRKARRMTIALADLFRYSINYSQNNYSTLAEELEMTDVYLQIEKIRFEDRLNVQVNVEPDLQHYLVPRFLLQPLAENAVKHALKKTGNQTEIQIAAHKTETGFCLTIADNGPAFPEEIMPGYGVKSVFDKMDLLFPQQYEIRFSNSPTKRVEIDIFKLLKNEPAV